MSTNVTSVFASGQRHDLVGCHLPPGAAAAGRSDPMRWHRPAPPSAARPAIRFDGESTLLPGVSCSRSRIGFGMVTWPLTVTGMPMAVILCAGQVIPRQAKGSKQARYQRTAIVTARNSTSWTPAAPPAAARPHRAGRCPHPAPAPCGGASPRASGPRRRSRSLGYSAACLAASALAAASAAWICATLLLDQRHHVLDHRRPRRSCGRSCPRHRSCAARAAAGQADIGHQRLARPVHHAADDAKASPASRYAPAGPPASPPCG